jgi:hypothetical protein
MVSNVQAEENPVARTEVAPFGQALAAATWLLAVLGAVMYWWVPLGMVLSLSGLVAGFIGWVRQPRRAGGLVAMLVVGMLLAGAALCWDLAAVSRGLDTVRFTALR